MLHSGHAPGHIRDTFRDAAEAFMAWNHGEPEPTVNHADRQIPISKACTLVWNCTDIIPGIDYQWLCDVLDIKRQTYAACARAMYAAIRQ